MSPAPPCTRCLCAATVLVLFAGGGCESIPPLFHMNHGQSCFLTWYEDKDGDGHGDPLAALPWGCLQEDGISLVADDCDDGNSAIFGSASERCDGLDNDCNGSVDDDPYDEATWYIDGDGDGYGDLSTTVLACDAPAGAVADATDCDDTAAAVNPGAAELCGDGVDNNCDDDAEGCGAVGDEALSALASASFCGESSAGSDIADGGDIDGDGHADVVLGAENGQYPSGAELGDVFVLAGPLTDRVLPDQATATLFFPGDTAGTGDVRSAGLGDLDGDGYADVGMGAPAMLDEGVVYLFHGPLVGHIPMADADMAVPAIGPSSAMGTTLAPGGDLDGDGRDDLLAGEPTASSGDPGGHAYIFLGPAEGDPAGSVVGDNMGNAMVNPGDTDGDGQSDLAVSDASLSNFSSLSSVFLFVALPELEAVPRDADAILGLAGGLAGVGAALAGADMDGDGYADLLIGAPGYSGQASEGGAVFLVLGPFSGDLSLDDAAATFVSGVAGAHAGLTLADGGDPDGDGIHNLFVGAPDEQQTSTDGVVWLLDGSLRGETTMSEARAAIRGSQGSAAGSALFGGTDLDEDGVADFLIGASGAGCGYLVAGGLGE